jgi:hypothetical protein
MGFRESRGYDPANDKTYPLWCDYCLSMKYGRPPERKDNDPYDWEPSPHYICADCLRKLLAKDEGTESLQDSITEATDVKEKL